MRIVTRSIAAVLFATFICLPLLAQQAQPAKPAAAQANAVAATVNGEPIPEIAIQRGLKRVPQDKHAEARHEILEFLIDNTLIEQNLLQRSVVIEKKEIDGMVEKIKAEIIKQNETTKQKHTFEEFMKELMLDETQLRAQIAADLRWEKFVNQQTDDKTLQTYCAQNKEMFDGSVVHARHILLTPKAGDAQAAARTQQQLIAWKKQVEDQAAAGVAKLPPGTDALEKEKARVKLIEDGFAAIAQKESACPSKEKGGDIGTFPRVGAMVEQFAMAAFALKPYQISEPIKTQFGYHLILTTEKKPGQQANFDKIKDDVKEVYAAKLREGMVAKLRTDAKIVVTPAK
jgi:parvulin-like peptidyl-prolyl isomerase